MFHDYAVTWLIVSHMTRTCVSSLGYDWLIVIWLTIVSHNDVMTFAHDSHYESWVSRMWPIRAHDLFYELWLVYGTLRTSLMWASKGFRVWLSMSHGPRDSCVWVTRVRVVAGRVFIRDAVGPIARLFTQPSKYFSILQILQYNYLFLSTKRSPPFPTLPEPKVALPGDYKDLLNGGNSRRLER